MAMTASDHSTKISVIVPMYNAAAFLKKTVESILYQTYKDFELLLIDDCSSDETLAIARSFSDSRIRIIENSKNLGAGGTRNKGIQLADSTYIAFCDADDTMFPNRLEEQMKYMDAHPETDICGSFLQVVNEEDQIIGKYTFPTEHEQIAVEMFLRCAFQQSTAFIRNRSFKRSGLEYKENHFAEDFDLWANAVKKLNFHILPQFLMCYRVSGSQTSTKSFNKQKRDAFIVYKQMMKELGVEYNEHVVAIHYEIAHRKKEAFPKEWAEEYERFCRNCLSKNRQTNLYNDKLWRKAIIHNYKKSQYLFCDKITAYIKTFFKFKL